MRSWFLFLPLLLAGCGKPILIEAWVLEADLQHPPGVRVMAEGETTPTGKVCTGVALEAFELQALDPFMTWMDQHLNGACWPCCMVFGGGFFGPRRYGKTLEMGLTDARGRVSWRWEHSLGAHLTELRSLEPFAKPDGLLLPEVAYVRGDCRLEFRVIPNSLPLKTRLLLEQGSSEQAKEVAGCLYEDDTVRSSWRLRHPPGLESLRDWSERGIRRAQFFLGMYLCFAKDLTPDERAEGEVWLRKSASGGYVPAQEALETWFKPAIIRP